MVSNCTSYFKSRGICTRNHPKQGVLAYEIQLYRLVTSAHAGKKGTTDRSTKTFTKLNSEQNTFSFADIDSLLFVFVSMQLLSDRDFRKQRNRVAYLRLYY